MKAEDLKSIVKEKYGKIATQSKVQNETSCCGATGSCSTVDYTIFSESYEKQKGYNAEADLGLGCGIPTQYAGIKAGDSVLDLGSGAGNDCFVARALVGETGHVTGIDFTEAMLEKAKRNDIKLGFDNVEFIQGDIEKMPMAANGYDVVVSNCVLNLVPDKNKAFAEIYRVLKPEGSFCISDVVLKGNLPEKLRKDAEMYAGCVSGAIEMDTYLDIINKNGFQKIILHKQKEIGIPEEVLLKFLTKQEITDLKKEGRGIFSITVSGYKV
jgi:arsenite methyltransferase